MNVILFLGTCFFDVFKLMQIQVYIHESSCDYYFLFDWYNFITNVQ